jgi:hypothetical protein
MADPIAPTRNQISAFVGNDPKAIRAIERLFKVAGQLTPADIVVLTQLVDLVTLAPAPQDPRLDRLLDVQAPSAAAGMVIIYDATKRRWLANTITAGSNITVTNADGAITVAVSGLGTMAFKNIGVSGSFIAGLKTVTVVDGIITSIV